MKNLLIILILCFSSSLISQESGDNPKEIYLYKTVEDFQNNRGEYLGSLRGHTWTRTGYKLSYFNEDGKKRSKAIGSYWGFRVGTSFFRYKKGFSHLPMLIRGTKGKTFYSNGEIYLSSIANESFIGSTWSPRFLLGYSDNLTSKIKIWNIFLEDEENNPEFSELFSCLEKAKESIIPGFRTYFNTTNDCIDSFINE